MKEKSITTEYPDGETIIIDPGTELDNQNAHEMVEVITGAQARGLKYIVIDMHRLRFISSAGVGSILGSVEESREAGGDIILCGLSDEIRNVFEVLDLVEFLTIRVDRQEALTVCHQ